MPRGYGTGPEGLGPRTGRGLGSCEAAGQVPARGRCRLGRGRGRQFRNFGGAAYHRPPVAKESQ